MFFGASKIPKGLLALFIVANMGGSSILHGMGTGDGSPSWGLKSWTLGGLLAAAVCYSAYCKLRAGSDEVIAAVSKDLEEIKNDTAVSWADGFIELVIKLNSYGDKMDLATQAVVLEQLKSAVAAKNDAVGPIFESSPPEVTKRFYTRILQYLNGLVAVSKFSTSKLPLAGLLNRLKEEQKLIWSGGAAKPKVDQVSQRVINKLDELSKMTDNIEWGTSLIRFVSSLKLEELNSELTMKAIIAAVQNREGLTEVQRTNLLGFMNTIKARNR